jgi:hypothetical protein
VSKDYFAVENQVENRSDHLLLARALCQAVQNEGTTGGTVLL